MLLINTNPVFCKISVTPLPHGRHLRRWEDNIKIDGEEIGLNMWTEVALLRIRTVAGSSAR
jgi:hypothetical protein